MLASVCSFPVSTLVAGILTRRFGPAVVFPGTGGVLVLAYLFGLLHREFRELGQARAERLARDTRLG
ncbi:MAG: hypothetical protein ACRDN0_38390 [Trebonia sp.]